MNNFQTTGNYYRKIQKAEEAAGSIASSRYALKLHLMPPAGWLNDPNGLCHKDGCYHIFFQYSPFDAGGCEKFWGHFTTKDFIRYDYLGAPLVTDTPQDRDGVYSGCALVEAGRMRIYYTGNVREPGTDGITTGREANTIYCESEDGIRFSPKQCLMTNADYPAFVTCHVRDPKVWKEQDAYYMVQGARTTGHTGCVLIFSSKDGLDWQYQKSLTTEKPFGYMWECPALFSLNGKQILSFSPQGVESEEFRFQNVYQSGYCMLTGDFREVCLLEEFIEWDMGFDFYAPQIFEDEKGRQLLIGWVGLPDADYDNAPTVADGWQHTLTFPRELTMAPDMRRVLQNPVPELAALRTRQLIPKTVSGEGITAYDSLLLYELEVRDIKAPLHITIAGELHLDWNPAEDVFSLFFTGESGRGRTIRKARPGALHRLRLYADVSALEVYLNNGEFVFSSRFYPQEAFHELTLSCADCSAAMWELAPITVNYNNLYESGGICHENI